MPAQNRKSSKTTEEQKFKELEARRLEVRNERKQRILNIIKRIDDRFYGPDTEHDPDEKAIREMYAMAIATEISSIMFAGVLR